MPRGENSTREAEKHAFESVCELNRKLLACTRRVYAELQKTDPDIVHCRQTIVDTYPGGYKELIKGTNGNDRLDYRNPIVG